MDIKNKKVVIALLLCVLGHIKANAQDWHQMNVDYSGIEWLFPINHNHVGFFDFNEDNTTLQIHFAEDEGIVVPFDIETSKTHGSETNGITLTDSLEDWGRDEHKVFAIYVTTDDQQPISSKEYYTHCYVSVDGRGEYPEHSAPARIRGRGNSTWEWYDKKPYRIKFDQSCKMLGIDKNKDWVLLANFRDMTKMMNTFAFITAKWMGLPFTTPIRYAELFINGEYKGLYQVTEQVEVGKNRVDIDENEGLLLTLDVDDGPANSPGADDNFWTKVYNMPMAVKNPKNLTSEQLDAIKEEFSTLETAIKAHDYEKVDQLMDIDSYIHMIQLQEYVYNVELSAPRSVFLFRDKDGKFTFGPAWDWDAGFDFEWSDMYTGHTYFRNYRETLLGTDPVNRNGDYRCPRFFTDLFASGSFVKKYKESWAEIADSIFERNWEKTQEFIDGINELQNKKPHGYSTPILRDTERWPVRNFTVAEETKKLKDWLKNRTEYLTPIIAAYPNPEGDDDPIDIPDEYSVVGTINKAYTLDYPSGYSQDVSVQVDKDELAAILGVEASTLNATTLDLVPLNSDGTEGNNTAAKNYGAWFDYDGDTNDWGYGHVYIESNDLFTLACGCHPDNCDSGDEHTVTMQYRHHETAKAVNLVVTFTIEGESNPWW